MTTDRHYALNRQESAEHAEAVQRDQARIDKLTGELVRVLAEAAFPGSEFCSCDFCRMRFVLSIQTRLYTRLGLRRNTGAWIGAPDHHGDLDE